MSEFSDTTNRALRPFDIFLFQIGDRGAILRVLASPWSLAVGAILVWTAGIARHYDFRELLIESQWLWAPFLVVLFSSFLIFCIFYLAVLRLSSKSPFMKQYTAFLGAFFFTAPIAWFYAIPIEFAFPGDPLTCAKINIGLLAVVSFWRVWLICRVLRVATGGNWFGICGAVLLGASIEAFVGSFFKSLDIVGLMGGFELSPTQEFLSNAYSFITSASFFLGIGSIILLIVNGHFDRGKPFPGLYSETRFPKPTFIAAAVTLLIWILIAIPFQTNDALRKPRMDLEKLARPQYYDEPPSNEGSLPDRGE